MLHHMEKLTLLGAQLVFDILDHIKLLVPSFDSVEPLQQIAAQARGHFLIWMFELVLLHVVQINFRDFLIESKVLCVVYRRLVRL